MTLLGLTGFGRKYKIPNCQQGYAYLTSLRVCYVDEKKPRKNSVAFDLQQVEKTDYQVRISSIETLVLKIQLRQVF